MIDIKVIKQFKDVDTGQDVYIMTIQIGKNYYSIPVTKDEFEEIYVKMRSIQNNNPLE